MSDRSALLSAIAACPAEDTPRLMYADWLAEHGESDLDRATEEFIRVSCSMRTTKKMPKMAYAWIEQNWERLVPALLKLCPQSVLFPKGISWFRQGRVIDFNPLFPYPVSRRRGGDRYCPMRLDFHRGLLRQAVIWSSYAVGLTLEAFVADQPNAVLKCPGLDASDHTFGTIASDIYLLNDAKAMYRALNAERGRKVLP
jgi:uncharacterized protein (TIGR02996 family)